MKYYLYYSFRNIPGNILVIVLLKNKPTGPSITWGKYVGSFRKTHSLRSFCSSPLAKLFTVSVFNCSIPLASTHFHQFIMIFFCTHHYLTIFIVYNIHSCYEACRGMSILMHILVSYFSLQSQGLRGKKFKSLFIRCFSTTMMRKQNPILKGNNCWKILWWSQIRINFDFLICQKVL